MSETVIIKPDITPEERLKRLRNIAAVLTRITGLKYEYIATDKEAAGYEKNKTMVDI